MHLFSWNSDKYRLGLPAIDAQHQRLVNLINELYDTLSVTSDKSIIDPILGYVVKLSREHFDVEERMMLDMHYPDIEAHIGRHMTFNETLATIIVQYQQGNIDVTLENLKYLSHWYIEHIKTADSHYCEFIKKESA